MQSSRGGRRLVQVQHVPRTVAQVGRGRQRPVLLLARVGAPPPPRLPQQRVVHHPQALVAVLVVVQVPEQVPRRASVVDRAPPPHHPRRVVRVAVEQAALRVLTRDGSLVDRAPPPLHRDRGALALPSGLARRLGHVGHLRLVASPPHGFRTLIPRGVRHRTPRTVAGVPLGRGRYKRVRALDEAVLAESHEARHPHRVGGRGHRAVVQGGAHVVVVPEQAPTRVVPHQIPRRAAVDRAPAPHHPDRVVAVAVEEAALRVLTGERPLVDRAATTGVRRAGCLAIPLGRILDARRQRHPVPLVRHRSQFADVRVLAVGRLVERALDRVLTTPPVAGEAVRGRPRPVRVVVELVVERLPLRDGVGHRYSVPLERHVGRDRVLRRGVDLRRRVGREARDGIDRHRGGQGYRSRGRNRRRSRGGAHVRHTGVEVP